MGDFLTGWKRKAGCVTLVMACLLVAFTSWIDRQEEYAFFSFGDITTPSHRGIWLWVDKRGSLKWEYGQGYYPFSCHGGIPQLKGTVPQWASTQPLILLSAVLIIWPQRKSSAPTADFRD